MLRSPLFWRRLLGTVLLTFMVLLAALVLESQTRGEASARSPAIWLLLLFTIVTALFSSWLAVAPVRAKLRQLASAARSITQGSYRQVQVGAADEYGELARAFNAMSQTLESRIARLELDREELRAVFRCMVEGVIVLDARQHVQFMNEAASRLLKLPMEAVSGRPLWDLARHRGLVDAAEAVLRAEEPIRREIEWSVRDQRTLALNGSNLTGTPQRGAVLVLQDISDLRKLERMRQEFVTNVSHELKTPLAAIQAGVETLLDGALHDPDHNVKFLERVKENAVRLDNLVHDLLTLNRIESGREHIEINPVELQPVVDLCLNRHEPHALARNVALRKDAPPEPAVVLADDEALDHLLDNLVDNAVKYTQPGGTVTLRWRTEGRECAIEVTDTGVGIPEKDLPRIFERFYRVDKARSRELGGTGLGLSIVKHLVQALSGSVRAESKVGKGSVFTVRLPLALSA